jgi:hypothetical protein
MSVFVLPKHIRFARSLALVSSAAVGIAAGAALLTDSGCGTNCTGICNYTPPKDAATDVTPNVPDAAMADALPPDAGAGGGPLPAPPLPAAWLS